MASWFGADPTIQRLHENGVAPELQTYCADRRSLWHSSLWVPSDPTRWAMYVESISMREFRTFKHVCTDFLHPDTDYGDDHESPRVPNMNLMIGPNGSGKTTLLKGIALAALGPAVAESGLFPYYLIRREPGELGYREASIKAVFIPNRQDRNSGLPESVKRVQSHIRIDHRGDLERLKWAHDDDKSWHPIYSSSSDAFFFVGYGSSRRVEKTDRVDEAGRRSSSFSRARRIMSLFEEAYSLLPLSHWLPRYQASDPARFTEVSLLVNRLLGSDRYRFTGEMEDGEYIFQDQNTRVPFPALSDGYRALLGWIGDLLYHVCETCPSGRPLAKNQGIVMIDEVDLHIHPGWQMRLLPEIAQQLPKVQFIVTSHSPLLVGSLEWKNIIVIQHRTDRSSLERVQVQVSRMDADQILLTDIFGLESTRSASQTSRIRELLDSARKGDTEAAEELMSELSGSNH